MWSFRAIRSIGLDMWWFVHYLFSIIYIVGCVVVCVLFSLRFILECRFFCVRTISNDVRSTTLTTFFFDVAINWIVIIILFVIFSNDNDCFHSYADARTRIVINIITMKPIWKLNEKRKIISNIVDLINGHKYSVADRIRMILWRWARKKNNDHWNDENVYFTQRIRSIKAAISSLVWPWKLIEQTKTKDELHSRAVEQHPLSHSIV